MDLNFYINEKDPKIILLKKNIDFFDNRKTIQIISRNGIHNTNRFMDCLKIIIIKTFFELTLSDLLRQLAESEICRNFFNIHEILEVQQFYEFISRVKASKFNNITNSILARIHKRNRKAIKTYLIDATPVATDINTIKKYISKEHLKDLKLEFGFSKTKKFYVGFKVTVTLDKDTLCPISILIHKGAPHDSKLFDKILFELKRRKLLSKGTIILCDKGYYSLENYFIGINKYKIIPVIFPKYDNTVEKILKKITYPLHVFLTKNNADLIKEYKELYKILIHKLENWKDFKPVRGLIEDFFKVAKRAFGLGVFHKYTEESISKSIYITLLLTSICIQQGYTTKTKMQQLSEGNIELRPPIKHRKKKKENKDEKTGKTKKNKKTKQDKLKTNKKEKITTLFDVIKSELFKIKRINKNETDTNKNK